MLTPKRPQVLFLAHRFPYPPDKGDRIRAFNIIKHLSTRCDVSLATLADEPVDPAHHKSLQQYCKQLEIVEVKRLPRLFGGLKSVALGGTVSEGMFNCRKMHGVINRWCSNTAFDTVVLSASSMARYLDNRRLNDAATIVDLVDVDSEKWREYAVTSRWPGRGIYSLEARRLRRLELALLKQSNAVTLVSQAEADLFSDISRSHNIAENHISKIQAISNGVDLDFFTPIDTPTEETCLFLGTMDYRPNIDGVTWFCREVWPTIRTQHPGCRFSIVGRNPSSAVRQLGQLEGVDVVGAVDDVRPWLAKSRVVVAPLRIARGVQNKVLEAMAMKKVVVASPEALTGINVTPGEHVMEAVTVIDWTKSITQALQADEAHHQMAQSAHTFTQQHHAWQAALTPLADHICGFPLPAQPPELSQTVS